MLTPRKYILIACFFIYNFGNYFSQGINYERAFNDRYSTVPDNVVCDGAFTYHSYVDTDSYRLVKLDDDGEILWSKYVAKYGHLPIGNIVPDNLGNVYISGDQNGTCDVVGIHEGYLAKFDPDGELLWFKEYEDGEFYSTTVTSGLSRNSFGGITVAIHEYFNDGFPPSYFNPTVEIYLPNGDLLLSLDIGQGLIEEFIQVPGYLLTGYHETTIYGFGIDSSDEIDLGATIIDLVYFNNKIFALLPDKVVKLNSSLVQESEQAYPGYSNFSSLKIINDSLQFGSLNTDSLSIISIDENLNNLTIENFDIPTSSQTVFDFTETRININQKYDLSNGSAVRVVDYDRNSSVNNEISQMDISISNIEVTSFEEWFDSQAIINTTVTVVNHSDQTVNSFGLFTETYKEICGPTYYSNHFNNVQLAPQDSVVVDANFLIGIPFSYNADGNPVVNLCMHTGDPNNTIDTNISNDEFCGGIEYLAFCESLESHVGDACDDEDDATVNDEVTSDCVCIGVVCPTDLNGDGETNGFDFSIFLGSYGLPCSDLVPCPTDLNLDGETNGADFAILLANFGLVCD